MTANHVTQIKFRCPTLKPTAAEMDPNSEGFINNGLFANQLADRVEPVLNDYAGLTFEREIEDHGVHFYGKGAQPFTVHVVCTNLGEDADAEHLVFVTPSKKIVRPFPWIKTYKTEPLVPDLVNTLKEALEHYSDVDDAVLVPDDEPL